MAKFIDESDLSLVVGTSLSRSAQSLNENYTTALRDPDYAAKLVKGKEMHSGAPELMIRAKLMNGLKLPGNFHVTHARGEEKGSIRDTTIVHNEEEFHTTLDDLVSKGREKATAISDHGEIIPSVTLLVGDILNGGLAKMLYQTIFDVECELSYTKRGTKALPRTMPNMDDLFAQYIPGYDPKTSTCSTKSETAYTIALAAARFRQFYFKIHHHDIVSSTDANRATSITKVPNIRKNIYCAGQRQPATPTFKQGEVMLLYNASLRGDLDKTPPIGTNTLFYANGHGEQRYSIITFDHLKEDAVPLKRLNNEETQKAKIAEWNGKPVYCVWRDYSTAMFTTPKLEKENIVMLEPRV